MDTLPVSEAIVRRRAERDFARDRQVPEEVISEILRDAVHAPSGYNLQPTHFILVDGDARRLLSHAALDQRQVTEAPVTVVVAADTRPDRGHGPITRAMDMEAGSIDIEYSRFLRRMSTLAFQRGPFGVLGMVKRWACAALSWLRPAPRLPAARPREWALAQSMIAATHVLLGAAARGVASCPMEGFDERRVRKLLGLPRHFVVALLIPLGYPREGDERPRRTRLPTEALVHRGRWQP